jgi:hypothetical protein
MLTMYTKNGRPLARRGDDLFSRSGKHVGRVRGNKVYDPSGRYAGSVVGNRVIYRSTESASIASPFVQSTHVGTTTANAVGVADWGDEPPFPD